MYKRQDGGWQPPIEQLATAVHRGSATRSWSGPLLLVCAARRGCNVVGVLCMLSDVEISAVSFGEGTQNIININTVEVLIFNPNDPYTSVHSKRGCVTHNSSRTGIRCGLRTAGSNEHNYCSHSSTAHMGVTYIHTVLPAAAYGRQHCNVVLCACSVVYLWCMSWAVCSLERAMKTDKKLSVRTYKIGLIHRNPGNRLIHF